LDKTAERDVVQFSDFVGSVQRIASSATSLQERIDVVDEHRPPVPVVRSAVERAALDLEQVIGSVTPFEQPSDMIDDEWGERSLVLLRASIATLELRASQRTSDLRDWMRDVCLAIEHFRECKSRFEREVEV
jgi:hypothetical protein